MPVRSKTKPEPAERTDPQEQALIALLMADLPKFHKDIVDIDRTWVSAGTGELLDALATSDPHSFSWDEFIKAHEDGTWKLEFAYVRSRELFGDADEGELGRQWQLVVARLGQRHLSDRARRMELDIRDAEERKDSGRVASLLTDFSRLKQDIAKLFHT